MKQITIVVEPNPAHGQLLGVADAFQQVIDMLRIHADARRAVAAPEERFEWRLERASTNSPLTITARADPLNPEADVTHYVDEVTRQFQQGIADLVERSIPPWWMDPETEALVTAVTKRNQNGIGRTLFDGGPGLRIQIDKAVAQKAQQTIEAADVLAVDVASGATRAWGIVQGLMVNAGTWYRRPAIRIITNEYGAVWCVLTPEVMHAYGHKATLEDIWLNKGLSVEGRLVYRAGNRLSHIVATDVQELPKPPRIDLDSVVDPDFTGGLDPVEYLRRLHAGDLG